MGEESRSEFIGTNSFQKLVLQLNVEKRKVFIVTGKNTFEKSGAGSLFREIFTSSDYYVFDDFSLNPKIEDAYNGMKNSRIWDKHNFGLWWWERNGYG